MPQAIPDDIWFFVYLRSNCRHKDLLKHFVEGGRLANQTFSNYLKDLLRAGKIDKTFDKRSDAIIYFIPEEEKANVKVLVDNKKFDRVIDEMTEKEAKDTLKELIHGGT